MNHTEQTNRTLEWMDKASAAMKIWCDASRNCRTNGWTEENIAAEAAALAAYDKAEGSAARSRAAMRRSTYKATIT